VLRFRRGLEAKVIRFRGLELASSFTRVEEKERAFVSARLKSLEGLKVVKTTGPKTRSRWRGW